MIVTIPEILTAPRVYTVNRATGNNSNDGITSPVSHIQRAIDLASAVIPAGFSITINVEGVGYGDEYLEVRAPMTGPEMFFINGDGYTRTEVGGILKVHGGWVNFNHFTVPDCDTEVRGAALWLGNCGIKYGVRALEGAQVRVSACDLESSNTSAFFADDNSAIHVSALTLTGTPDYSDAFAVSKNGSVIRFEDQPTGAATGARYLCDGGRVIAPGFVLPGNAAGSEINGGDYA